jgi:predicted DNA-binding transcriptional regulator YafY
VARNQQLIRQHKILQILERYRFGRTLDEIRTDLIDELGLPSLHTRSVRRDLDALQAAGFDVQVQVLARGKIWKLGPAHRGTHTISASATELMALSLGRDLLVPLAGTAFWQGIESFWNKIRDQLPKAVWQHYEKYRRSLFVVGTPAKSYRDKQGILKTINRGILEHRVVSIEYQSPGKAATWRHIEPYAVAFYQSSLYVIAAFEDAARVTAESTAVPDDQDVAFGDRLRHWKLDRFCRAKLLDKWFKPPTDFDVAEHLGRSLGIFSGSRQQDYRIRISARAAPWVLEDPWHPDQRVKRRRDGRIELTVQASHDLEIIPRVLALGGEAEVLSPASCRREVARQIEEMASRYRHD